MPVKGVDIDCAGILVIDRIDAIDTADLNQENAASFRRGATIHAWFVAKNNDVHHKILGDIAQVVRAQHS